MLLRYDISILIYLIPAILISLTFHELSHAFVSYKLGDPTAKNMGRLTLNPMKHLDILGTIMLLVSSFGWAKPVPINPMYYDDKKKGTMLVSLAGPASNILIAIIFAIPMYYMQNKYNIPEGTQFIGSLDYRAIIYNFGSIFVIINIGLAVFNLLPVPPLDGSKILGTFLSQRQYYKMIEYERYISLGFLFVVFVFPGVLSMIMSPLVLAVSSFIKLLAEPIARLFL